MSKYHMHIKFFFTRFIVLSLSLLLFSCSSTEKSGKTQAEVLYKEAKELYDNSRYLLAIEKLNEIRTQHPYSFYATQAELLQADIYYKQENFIESQAAYQLFKEMHPKNQNLDYVTWKIAESYFNQLPSTFDRDLSPSLGAQKYYQMLIEQFPKSPHLNEAKERLSKIDDMLKNKEKYIIGFYFKVENYSSARYRCRKVLNEGLLEKKLQNYCLEIVLKSSLELKEFNECINDAKTYHQNILESDKDLSSLITQCNKQPSA